MLPSGRVWSVGVRCTSTLSLLFTNDKTVTRNPSKKCVVIDYVQVPTSDMSVDGGYLEDLRRVGGWRLYSLGWTVEGFGRGGGQDGATTGVAGQSEDPVFRRVS